MAGLLHAKALVIRPIPRLTVLPLHLFPEDIPPLAGPPRRRRRRKPIIDRRTGETAQDVAIAPSRDVLVPLAFGAQILAGVDIIPLLEHNTPLLLPPQALPHVSGESLRAGLSDAVAVPRPAHDVPDADVPRLLIPPTRAEEHDEYKGSHGRQGDVQLSALGQLRTLRLESRRVRDEDGGALVLDGLGLALARGDDGEGEVGGLFGLEDGGSDFPGVDAPGGGEGVCGFEGLDSVGVVCGGEAVCYDGDAPFCCGVGGGFEGVVEEVGVPGY